MKKPTQLSRTCTLCGQQKPLSAFLQFGPQGATYGNMCSACRGIQAKQPNKDTEESSTSNTGVAINAKTKVQQEIDKKLYLRRLKTLHQGDKKKKDLVSTEKTEKSEGVEKAEKFHRQTYIEGRKKESFLGTFNKKVEAQKHAVVIQKTREEATITKSKITEHAALQARHTDAANQHEQRITSTDFSVPYYDPQFSELKYQSPIFQQFRTWLGSSAPITRAIEQLFGKPGINAANSQANNNPTNTEKDPVVDYVNKNWGSTRRR